jgi:hypothetical protein
MTGPTTGPLRTVPAGPTATPTRVLEGDRVTRVAWLPGSDRLLGECSCGARAEGGDPIGMWQWLLAHPDHPVQVAEPDSGTAAVHVPPPHRVARPEQAAGPRTPLR